jgi:phosphate acetyltransferase
MMVKMGDADGFVSGASHPTADTLKPALQIIKGKPETPTVSAFFIMDLPDKTFGDNGVFIYADSGMNENPDSEALSDIAISSANSYKELVNPDGTPRVAMLSYSTKGSAHSELTDKVIDATNKVRAKAPDLIVDGELQLDAALVPEVGELKAPGSKVAGHANTLVFPSLEAGNIGYKLVQRLAKAGAYGPILQGLSLPVNDLSRGCYAEDIVGTVALTAVQAQNAAK